MITLLNLYLLVITAHKLLVILFVTAHFRFEKVHCKFQRELMRDFEYSAEYYCIAPVSGDLEFKFLFNLAFCCESSFIVA